MGENPLARHDPCPTLPRPRALPARPAQPLDSAPRLRRPPRPAEPPPARPAPRPRGPRGRDPRPGTPRTQPGGFGSVTARRPTREGGRGPRSPVARATGGGAGRRDPAGGGPRAGTPTSAPGFVRRMQAPSPARPRVSPRPRPGPRGGGSVSWGRLGCEEGAGASCRRLPVVPERPPPPPPYRGAAPAGPRPAPAHWLRSARSRLRGPGAAADPLCALSFPRSASPAFVCPPPRPRATGTSTISAGPALARLGKPAAPPARSGPKGTGAGGYRAPQGEDEFRL